MVIAPLSIQQDYWDQLQIRDADLEYLYNHLLETETPMTTRELVRVMVLARIESEKKTLEKDRQASGAIYQPKAQFEAGQALQFPALAWKQGVVVASRDGLNPEYPDLKVIEVEFEDGARKEFAANLLQHELNQPIQVNLDDPLLSIDYVVKSYGKHLVGKLDKILSENPDIVQIAGYWFPIALLVDINAGHKNLAEAILDMEGGGPLTTREIMEQLDLPTDVNTKLTEFSLNLSLQEDNRFDEVGPAGQILWFLHRLEPEPVTTPPVFLRHQAYDYDTEYIAPYVKAFDRDILDELELVESDSASDEVDEVTVTLTFPHWRAGTLPIAGVIPSLFPTAYEAPRVRFSFVDAETNQRFSGWVVRPFSYIYGLREWYEARGLFPGSQFQIKRSAQPGEVIVSAGKKRPSREWIRTAVVGADGGIVFAMLKHNISVNFDERMAIMVPDPTNLDHLWEQNKVRGPLQSIVKSMMSELEKLSPQGHVHGEELYAAVNLIRRCPPGAILSVLDEANWSSHLGDLYFRLKEVGASDEEE